MRPLVPADVDLADFAFMPFEFQRLFASETWILSNDAEKVAALTLWGRSWHEVPAGSLPADDRMLAHLSGAGSRWGRVKAMALRGWVHADDGRYYHPVVCEKALEAWAEKLAQRLKSGAGNAKRWGTEFDPAPVLAQLTETRSLLAALNPVSRQLAKPVPDAVPRDPLGNPTGIAKGVHAAVAKGSQGTGTGTGKEEAKADTCGEKRSTVALIPLDDGSDYAVRQETVAEFTAAYPRIDVIAELAKARAWCLSNPKNRKTRGGAARFLNSWMSRANDRAAPPTAVEMASQPGGGRRRLS